MRKRSVNAVFSEEEILAIRNMAKEVTPQGRRVWSASEIARTYSDMGRIVSTETVRRIIRRETWQHVSPGLEEQVSSSERIALEASAEKLFRLQEEMKGQRVLDELMGQQEGEEDGCS